MKNSDITSNIERVKRWIVTYDRELQSTQHTATTGLPGTKGRLEHLILLQKRVVILIRNLIRLFWLQKPNQKKSILSLYLKTLENVKLVCDDVFVEGSHEARLQNNDAKLREIQVRYVDSISDWIRGSPFLDPRSIKNDLAFLSNINTSEPFISNFDIPLWLYLRKLINNDKEEIKKGNSFRKITEHLLGLKFIKIQLDLKLRSESMTGDYSSTWLYYYGAQKTINMLKDLLDSFSIEIRKSLIEDNHTLADNFVEAHRKYILKLATVYTIQFFDTSVLFAFFSKQQTKGKFQFDLEVVGVNNVHETISSYAGNPNPDDHDNGKILNVDTLLDQKLQYNGQPVRVFGLFNSSGPSLSSEISDNKVQLGLKSTEQVWKFSGSKEDRRVIVNGVVQVSGKDTIISNANLQPHSFDYFSKIGFPISFKQEDTSVPLKLVPNWRVTGPGIEGEAVRELKLKSLPATILGQFELVNELLSHSEVRHAFEEYLKKRTTSQESKELWKQYKMVDLNVLEIRTIAWQVLFRKFYKEDRETAFQRLFTLMNQYLKYYTRHTYYNVRDEDDNYLISKWPTDLTGSEFFDCGVYAVRVAYDIYKAVHGSDLIIEFRFITFLNHISLIGFIINLIEYTNELSFLVNNDKIYSPKHISDDKYKSMALWAQEAYAIVYDVDYEIFLVMFTDLNVTTEIPDSRFTNELWDIYKKMLFWGLASEAAIPGKGKNSYFDNLNIFNKESKKLSELIKNINKNNSPINSDNMNIATKSALNLYDIADKLANKGNFVAKTKIRYYPRIGYGSRNEPIAGREPSLPMYDVVDILNHRQKKGEDLTADQKMLIRKPVRREHMNDLTKPYLENQP